MEFNTWEIENLQEKIEKEKQEAKIKSERIFNYEDNYITEHKNYCAFPAVSNFLNCSVDYSDKNIYKLESFDVVKDRLKNDLEISLVAGLDQRINHIASQHTNPQYLFFKNFI